MIIFLVFKESDACTPMNALKAYYNEIKNCSNKESFGHLPWEGMYLNKDTSHNPNAISSFSYNGTLPTFYSYYARSLYYKTYTDIIANKPINIEEFIDDRSILFDAEDQRALYEEYCYLAMSLYIMGIRDPNILDPLRHDHVMQYIKYILSVMASIAVGDFSVFDEDIMGQAINFYIENYHNNDVEIGVSNFHNALPFEVVNRHLAEIDYRNLFCLVHCYHYPITYERVLELNSPKHTCMYLLACETLPENIDINYLQHVFVVSLGEARQHFKDERMCELVRMYHKAFPSETMNEIIEGISALGMGAIPRCLLPLIETVKYEPSVAFNTECLVCMNSLTSEQEVYVFKCRHCICKECLSEYKSIKCPICGTRN